jgi:predicted dehydrogenase
MNSHGPAALDPAAPPLRVGVVGAGRVTQAIHLPLLLADRDRFRVCGVVDPSPSVRRLVRERFGIEAVHAELELLLDRAPDAVICATPVPSHVQVTVAALEHGAHVLCEKPLAFTAAECEEIVHARDAAGLVVQVGYMKRHDEAVRALLDRLPADAAEVRDIAVEVYDPHHLPFTHQLDLLRPDDVPEEIAAAAADAESARLREVAGEPIDGAAARALRHGFAGSIVHNVNLIHATLARLGHPVPAEPESAGYWFGGDGVEASFRLEGGGRARASHLRSEGVPRYLERMTVVCEDRMLELTVPSPYADRAGGSLVEYRRGEGHRLARAAVVETGQDGFSAQLTAWHAAIVAGAEVVTPPEEAVADMRAIETAFRLALRSDRALA